MHKIEVTLVKICILRIVNQLNLLNVCTSMFRIILLLLLLPATVLSQNKWDERVVVLDESNEFSKKIQLTLVANKKETPFQSKSPFTAINVEIPNGQTFDGLFVEVEGEKIPLIEDADVLNNQRLSSNLIILQKPGVQFGMYSTRADREVVVNLIYTPPYLADSSNKTFEKSSAKDKPESIDQSVWRAGLPEPKNRPTSIEVNHVILHHSAGSNTDTNYINVVRNIYIYHTETNNWDDIGYNFVVAQNGTVFDGRDGKGTFEEDNIQGAHYCGKNNGTMGVCLLGNYDNVEPTDTSLRSIEKLIAWKLNKELLDPYDYYNHPNANDNLLGVVSGHRDGCNTACPGEIYIARKDNIKFRVCESLDYCDVIASVENKENVALVYPNPVNNFLNIDFLDADFTEIVIVNLKGEVVEQEFLSNERNTIDLRNLSSGLYLLKVTNSSTTYRHMIRKL
jgi:hypothetical protein